jgi:hypothetical protein
VRSRNRPGTFSAPTRPAVIQLLLCRLNDPEFIRERRQWLAGLVTLGPPKRIRVLGPTTPLNLIQAWWCDDIKLVREPPLLKIRSDSVGPRSFNECSVTTAVIPSKSDSYQMGKLSNRNESARKGKRRLPRDNAASSFRQALCHRLYLNLIFALSELITTKWMFIPRFRDRSLLRMVGWPTPGKK